MKTISKIICYFLHIASTISDIINFKISELKLYLPRHYRNKTNVLTIFDESRISKWDGGEEGHSKYKTNSTQTNNKQTQEHKFGQHEW
jgi:hypothetical protein